MRRILLKNLCSRVIDFFSKAYNWHEGGFYLRDARLLLQNLRDSIICKKTFIKRKNLIVTKKQKKRMEEEDRFLSQFQHFGLLWWDKTIQKIFCKKKVQWHQLFEDAAWLALLNSSEAKGLGQSSTWKVKYLFLYT